MESETIKLINWSLDVAESVEVGIFLYGCAVQYAGDKKRLSRLTPECIDLFLSIRHFLIQPRPITKWNNSGRKTCLSRRFYGSTARAGDEIDLHKMECTLSIRARCLCMAVGGEAIDDLWQREIAFLPLINLVQRRILRNSIRPIFLSDSRNFLEDESWALSP